MAMVFEESVPSWYSEEDSNLWVAQRMLNSSWPFLSPSLLFPLGGRSMAMVFKDSVPWMTQLMPNSSWVAQRMLKSSWPFLSPIYPHVGPNS